MGVLEEVTEKVRMLVCRACLLQMLPSLHAARS